MKRKFVVNTPVMAIQPLLLLLAMLAGFQQSQPAGVIVCVNAASYSQPRLARGSIVAAFGRGLASGTEAPAEPSEEVLGVRVYATINRDGPDALVPAKLLFVSPGQVNFILPDVPELVTLVRLRASDGREHVGYIEVVDSAPGLFTVAAGGVSVALGHLNGQPTAVCDPECRAVPLELTMPIRNLLFLYGTGMVNCPDLGVLINGFPVGIFTPAVHLAGSPVEVVTLSLGQPAPPGPATIQCRCGDEYSNTGTIYFK